MLFSKNNGIKGIKLCDENFLAHPDIIHISIHPYMYNIFTYTHILLYVLL